MGERLEEPDWPECRCGEELDLDGECPVCGEQPEEDDPDDAHGRAVADEEGDY